MVCINVEQVDLSYDPQTDSTANILLLFPLGRFRTLFWIEDVGRRIEAELSIVVGAPKQRDHHEVTKTAAERVNNHPLI
jgi:hypothetical protein